MSSYEIKLGTSRTGERVIQLHGEFDLLALRELSETIEREAGQGHATVVDLSGVSFADLRTLRELSEALLSYPELSLRNPSWQVLHGVRSCCLGERIWFEEEALAGVSRKAS